MLTAVLRGASLAAAEFSRARADVVPTSLIAGTAVAVGRFGDRLECLIAAKAPPEAPGAPSAFSLPHVGTAGRT